MSNVTVCVRFRPLSSREERFSEGKVCVLAIDSETFVLKDKEEEMVFCFDKVFYKDSEQEDVYNFLVKPIVQGAVNAINGTVITYGQTGAGKTYTMEGPSVLDCDELERGILPRVVYELFESIKPESELHSYMIKLSMVEIYMERVRDLFDLSKDNLQIKEAVQGLYLAGATEIPILKPEEALDCLANGIANRAVGETQMNVSSSRSHCIYLFSVQRLSPKSGRMRIGKLLLVDLAGSEKVEKTGAEGKVLEEAKTINKSLSALGNVINGLTTESLSTLRFGTRSKLIRTTLQADARTETAEESIVIQSPTRNASCDKILEKLKENLSMEDVRSLEELFTLEGLLYDPQSAEELQSLYEDTVRKTILILQQTVKELICEIKELRMENGTLKAELAAASELDDTEMKGNRMFKLSDIFSLIRTFFKLPYAFRRNSHPLNLES